jgi:hypothetical protein
MTKYLQPILRLYFRVAFKRWLDEGDKVIKVLGWRTAMVDSKWGSRKCMTPLFWIFK